MSDEADAVLGHRNLISYCRAITAWTGKGALHEDGRALLYAGGSWIPVIGNGAFRIDDTLPGGELIAQAETFFGRLGRGYSIKVRDDGRDDDLRVACEAAGLTVFGDAVPEMVCRRRLDDPVAPDGVTLRPVLDEQGVADFVAVNTDAYATYGMPPDVLVDMFDRPDRMLANDDTAVVVAYLGDRPVAAALAFLSDGIAGLQWVGTVADVRQMRLGRAVTEWATNLAFDCGAATCTLQASPMGEPLYAKLGYETLYRYREHVRWTAPTL